MLGTDQRFGGQHGHDDGTQDPDADQSVQPGGSRFLLEESGQALSESHHHHSCCMDALCVGFQQLLGLVAARWAGYPEPPALVM